MTDTDLKAIIDKVQRLLRLADRTDGPEAETAQRQAQRLMARYRIDAAAVEAADPNQRQPLGERVVDEFGRMPTWRVRLAVATAQANGCVIYLSGGTCIKIVGRRDNTEIATLLYRQLGDVIDKTARREVRGQGRAWGNSFRLGAVQRLGERLQEAAEAEIEQARQLAQTTSDSTALAVVERVAIQRQESATHMYKTHPNMRRGRRRPGASVSGGFHAGRRAAESMPTGVSSNRLGE